MNGSNCTQCPPEQIIDAEVADGILEICRHSGELILYLGGLSISMYDHIRISNIADSPETPRFIFAEFDPSNFDTLMELMRAQQLPECYNQVLVAEPVVRAYESMIAASTAVLDRGVPLGWSKPSS